MLLKSLALVQQFFCPEIRISRFVAGVGESDESSSAWQIHLSTSRQGTIASSFSLVTIRINKCALSKDHPLALGAGSIQHHEIYKYLAGIEQLEKCHFVTNLSAKGTVKSLLFRRTVSMSTITFLCSRQGAFTEERTLFCVQVAVF